MLTDKEQDEALSALENFIQTVEDLRDELMYETLNEEQADYIADNLNDRIRIN